MKKFLAPFAVGAAVALAVHYFQNQNSPQTAAAASEQGVKSEQHFANPQEIALATVVAPWELNSLDPNQSGVIFQRMNLAETLVEANSQGQLVPSLATKWHSNDAGDVWQFSLRPNVSFHNGSVLTADAVANSLNIALAKPGILKKAFIKQIRVVDPLNIEIKLTKPFMLFPSFLTHYSTLILAPEAYNDKGEVTQLIGTGAFKPTQIEPPQKLQAVRFDRYWGEKPQLVQAHYLASSRSETRMLMAQSEPSSLVFNLDTASIARLKNDPKLNITSGSIARTIQLKMDVAKPFFNDIAVRKALSQAINRKAIAEQVLKIDNGMAEQILPPAFADWRIDAPEQAVDFAQIKANLVAAGYQFSPDGKLTKNGKPFTFTLRTFSDRPELPIIATILQAQWKQIGVDMQVSIGNFSEIPAGHQDGSLEMALYALNYGKTIDPFGVIAQDYAKNGSDWGVMNWSNPLVDNALQQLETERDPAVAKALKQQVSQVIHDELPIIPIVYYQQNVVAHKAIKNLTLDPFERRFLLEKLSQ